MARRSPHKPPPKDELERMLAEHGGNAVHLARSLGVNRNVVCRWIYDYGMRSTGKGGAASSAPPEARLRELYERYNGNVADMVRALGAPRSSVKEWVGKLGLRPRGNDHEYKRTYPREIRIEVPEGYLIAFSDAHWWGTEKSRAHEALVALVKKLKPKVLIANGDLLDGARISRHDPSGLDETPTFSDELHACQSHMAELKRLSSGAEAFFCWGNHDSRLAKYIARSAPELLDVEGARLDHHILGWRFCWSVRVGDELLVMHRFRGGQHNTFTNTLRAGMTIATGHTHSQRVYPFTDATGTRWGVDLGCLAEIHSPAFAYTEANPMEWRSGFAVFEFRGGKLLPPQLVTVLDDGAVWWQRNERVL